MNALVYTISTLAVACIYCVWQGYKQRARRRERILRERVAYMLWILADSVECEEPVHASAAGQRGESEYAQLDDLD